MLYKIYCLKEYFMKKHSQRYFSPVLTTFLNYTDITDTFILLSWHSIQGSSIYKLCIGDRPELQISHRHTLAILIGHSITERSAVKSVPQSLWLSFYRFWLRVSICMSINAKTAILKTAGLKCRCSSWAVRDHDKTKQKATNSLSLLAGAVLSPQLEAVVLPVFALDVCKHTSLLSSIHLWW